MGKAQFTPLEALGMIADEGVTEASVEGFMSVVYDRAAAKEDSVGFAENAFYALSKFHENDDQAAIAESISRIGDLTKASHKNTKLGGFLDVLKSGMAVVRSTGADKIAMAAAKAAIGAATKN